MSTAARVKRIAVIVFLSLIVLAELVILGIIPSADERKAGIVTSSYVAYDFVSKIVGDEIDVTSILPTGADIHDFEPTPSNIKAISKAKFFIYNGGESDTWADKIIKDNDIKSDNVIKMIDFVDPIKEEDEDEYDEHIWTSPINAIRIIEAIRDRIVAKYPDKKDKFTENADKYIAEIKEVDTDIRSIVDSAKRKTLVFADRFPFRYFVDEYKLDYVAAFPGCSDQTEASSQTVAKLIDAVKENNIPVVLHTEQSDGSLAQTIADETGAEVRIFNSAHASSFGDYHFDDDYVKIMKRNVEVLREALN